jgi:hypothetical protein
MIKKWNANVELNWDRSNCEDFIVKANTELKARKFIAEAVKKKYPDVGIRFNILNIKPI